MKILLVIDQFDQGNNGTTISARRFAQALAADGNEVRVAATGKPARGKYPMPEIHFLPVADSIIRSQGMVFAKPNRSVLEQAIAWADVVHFMMPFALSRVGLQEDQEYPQGADLLILPFQGSEFLEAVALEVVERLQPKRILLDHFDDAFPPVSEHVDTRRFKKLMDEEYPQIKVVKPTAGKTVVL